MFYLLNMVFDVAGFHDTLYLFLFSFFDVGYMRICGEDNYN
jgi:hypothetical protein